jgi:hypothetical protein
MSALKVTKHREDMEDHGEDFRIEKRNRVEEDGTYHWEVYRRQHTGLKVKDEHADKGLEFTPGVKLHANEHLEQKGKHPVIKGEDGKPVETNVSHVWVPVFVGPENAARMRLRSLTEGK